MQVVEITGYWQSQTPLTSTADVKNDNAGLIQPVIDGQVMPGVDERWDKLQFTMAHLAAAVSAHLLTTSIHHEHAQWQCCSTRRHLDIELGRRV